MSGVVLLCTLSHQDTPLLQSLKKASVCYFKVLVLIHGVVINSNPNAQCVWWWIQITLEWHCHFILNNLLKAAFTYFPITYLDRPNSSLELLLAPCLLCLVWATDNVWIRVHAKETVLDSDLLVWQLISCPACLPVEVLMVHLSATVCDCNCIHTGWDWCGGRSMYVQRINVSWLTLFESLFASTSVGLRV